MQHNSSFRWVKNLLHLSVWATVWAISITNQQVKVVNCFPFLISMEPGTLLQLQSHFVDLSLTRTLWYRKRALSTSASSRLSSSPNSFLNKVNNITNRRTSTMAFGDIYACAYECIRVCVEMVHHNSTLSFFVCFLRCVGFQICFQYIFRFLFFNFSFFYFLKKFHNHRRSIQVPVF